MQHHRKSLKTGDKETTFQKIEKLHPHKMLLYLSMFGSSLVFLFMITAYSISRPEQFLLRDFDLPKAFILSTIVLLISSFTLSKVIQAYKEDRMKWMRNALGITLFLGLVFTVCQYIGWLELSKSGIYFSGKISGSFLYVISGLHILHLSAGMIFLSYFFYQSTITANDPVKSLIMVTNPYQKIRLEILTTYWYFMNALWLILFLYFLFTI